MTQPRPNASKSVKDDVARSPNFLQRRVPQIVGLYLAGSYTVFEMAQWIVKRFDLARVYEDMSLFGLLSFLPAVVLLAWGHGAPGRDSWSRPEKICLPLNLVASLGLLTLLWSGDTPPKPAAAANAESASPERRVDAGPGSVDLPPAVATASRATVLAFAFDNRGSEKAEAWIGHGIPLALEIDLGQEPRVTVHALVSGGFGEDLRKAAYQGGVDVPLSLMLQLAQDGEFDKFVTGSFEVTEASVDIELRLYEAEMGTIAATLHGSGPGLMEAIDDLSVQLKENLGLSTEEIAQKRDLPAAEAATTSLPAFRDFVLALVDENFSDDFESAIEHIDNALALDPSFAFAHLRRATIMLTHEKWRELAPSIQAALKHRYRLSESSIFVAQVIQLWLIDRKPAEALLAIEQWIKHSPRDVMARQMQSNIKAGLGDYKGALSALEALQAVESKATYDKGHADLLVALGRHAEARAEFAAFVKKYPKEHKGYLGLAGVLQILGEHDLALDAYQKAVAVAPSDPQLIQSLASQLVDMGKYDEALVRYTEALHYSQTDAEKSQALVVLADFYHHRGQIELALSTLEKSWKLSEGISTAEEMHALRMKKAWMVAEAGRTDEALALAAAARPSMTADADSLGAFGYQAAASRLYIELGDLARAQAASDEIQRIGLSYGFSAGRLAASRARLLSAQGKHVDALAAYNDLLAEFPNALDVRIYLGEEELALDDLDGALRRVQFVLARQPAQPRAHFLAAKIAAKQDQRKSALRHLAQALETWEQADPLFKEAAEARALLASLEGTSARASDE